MRSLIAVGLLTITSSAGAAERGYSVTDFERIDVSGPYVVTVETGKSPSARATGSAAALDRLKVETQGRTLIIRPGANGWGGWPGEKQAAPSIRITVPMLRSASLTGSGNLRINKMKAQAIQLGNSGSGQLAVDQLRSDKLYAQLFGSGALSIGGASYGATINTEGSGQVNAAALVVDTLILTSSSAGTATISAKRTAKVTATGSGNVTVAGSAACTVTAIGSGNVSCGNARR